MNIVEKMQEVLNRYPKINDLHIDYNESAPDNFGLYSTGDKLVSEDILGNQERSHTFILYANFQSFNDYDRLQNSGVLLELQHWFEFQYWSDYEIIDREVTVQIDGGDYFGELEKVTCANGMLFSIPDENVNTAVRYQLQITADYTINTINTF